jgi:hypothetical protein
MTWPHVPQKLACGLISWPHVPQNRRATSVGIGIVDIIVILHPSFILNPGFIVHPGFIYGLALFGWASEPLLIFGRSLLMTFVVGPRRRFGSSLICLGGRFGSSLICLGRRL